MLTYTVPDMTCGHCVNAITQALHALDPAAAIDTDLALHRVKIHSAFITEAQARAALEDAGYTVSSSLG
jgi:copper chaperone